MVRRVAHKAMWVGRTTATLMGLAVALAVVLGVATVALAAVPGDPFRLGQNNVINNAVSRLVGSNPGGPMLAVDNDSAAAGSRALDLRVEPNRAPMTVNAEAGKAANLNADRLDGKDFGAFDVEKVIGIQGPLPREGTYVSKGGTLILWASGSGFRGTGQSLTEGRIGMRVMVDGVERGFANVYTNERDSHKAFLTDYRVIEGLPAGEHTIRLEAVYFAGTCNVSGREDRFDYCTTTDTEDFFRVLVMEIPD